jgi:hypothetical protein
LREEEQQVDFYFTECEGVRESVVLTVGSVCELALERQIALLEAENAYLIGMKEQLHCLEPREQ